MSKENPIEEKLIKQLTELKYTYRADIVDRKTLEQNFKSKFEALNRDILPKMNFCVCVKKSLMLMSLLLRKCS